MARKIEAAPPIVDAAMLTRADAILKALADALKDLENELWLAERPALTLVESARAT